MSTGVGKPSCARLCKSCLLNYAHCLAHQGPSDYEVRSPGLPKGGKWTMTTIKSALELQMERAAVIPGPGQYEAPVAIRTDKVRGVRRRTRSCRHCVFQLWRCLGTRVDA